MYFFANANDRQPGPALGVLAQRKTQSLVEPFGKQTVFFEELASAAKALNMEVVFFSPQDLLCSACLAWESEWKKQGLSTVPDVVYDRFLHSNADEWNLLQKAHSQLAKSGCRITNPLELTELLRDKLGLHQFLVRHDLPTILPIRLEEVSEGDLDRLLAAANGIYIKPISGSKGGSIGVLTAEKTSLIFYDGTGLDRHHFPNLQSSLHWLKCHFDCSRTMIMRSAQFSRFSRSTFDIRVLVQNTEIKQYVVTGMAARLGREGAWVSNLAKGGRALTITKLMEKLQPGSIQQAGHLTELLVSLSLEFAHLLHEKCGSFAEVGIDFVLDSQSAPLFLEANSKPARWIFTQLAYTHPKCTTLAAEFRELRRRSVQTPLAHALAFRQHHKQKVAE